METCKHTLEYIENYSLPNGGLYSGQCKKNGTNIEIVGQGRAYYPDGTIYKGMFCNNTPNGIGYLSNFFDKCSFSVGTFSNKILNGWGIEYSNSLFRFGWWEDHHLLQDETPNTLWVRSKITERVIANNNEGNIIQMSEKDLNFIRFGTPNYKRLNRISGKEIIFPSIGFNFFKDGRVIVGEFFEPEITGTLLIYNQDRSSKFGYWENSVLFNQWNLQDYQSPDDYIIKGLHVFLR